MGAFEASGGWELDGSATMTAWTRVHHGWTNHTANRWLRRARRLRGLPVTQAAWAHGHLTDAQLEIIVANLVLLCSRHHHHIHMTGWHTKLTPDGTLEIAHPDSTTRTSDPPLLC